MMKLNETPKYAAALLCVPAMASAVPATSVQPAFERQDPGKPAGGGGEFISAGFM